MSYRREDGSGGFNASASRSTVATNPQELEKEQGKK